MTTPSQPVQKPVASEQAPSTFLLNLPVQRQARVPLEIRLALRSGD